VVPDNIISTPTMNTQSEIQRLFEYAKSQPFYCINDVAYERTLRSLQNGEASVKTFVSHCPASCKCKCTCPYFLNILNPDGDFPAIIRVVDGVKKPVLSRSMVREN